MLGHLPPLQRLQQLAQLEREDISTLIAYGIGIGLMSLATPIAMQALVNTIAFGALFQPLLVLTLILFVLTTFSNTLAALQFYVVEMLQRRLFVRFFSIAADKLQQADFSVRDKQNLPELSNRFFDVVTLQKTASVILLETMGYVLQTLIGMLLLAFYHPVLLAFDLFLIAMLVFILFFLGKHGINTAIEQSKAKYAAAAWLESIADNPLLWKSASAQSFLRQKTEHIAIDYLDACTQHFRILARQNIAALALHALANTLLLGLGGWMVIERQLSLGQLIAAELVVNTMIYGLTRLGKTLDNFYELSASVDKIGHLLDLPQENRQGDEYEASQSAFRVEFHNVGLAQKPQLDTLRHINLHIEPGESIVISSGAERGSLLDLLFGLRLPDSGFIRLDKQDLRNLNPSQIRNSMALIRHPEIMEANIADNLRMGRDIDLISLQNALIQVGLHDCVANLPEGLNTHLHRHGTPLTREECLRLALARALLTRPRLLMLDRVLDRIEAKYLPILLDSLFATQAPWTLLITSQCPQVIKCCSRHVLIEQGAIVEMTADQEYPG